MAVSRDVPFRVPRSHRVAVHASGGRLFRHGRHLTVRLRERRGVCTLDGEGNRRRARARLKFFCASGKSLYPAEFREEGGDLARGGRATFETKALVWVGSEGRPQDGRWRAVKHASLRTARGFAVSCDQTKPNSMIAAGLSRLAARKETIMNKPLALIILIVGVILTIYGISASDSVGLGLLPSFHRRADGQDHLAGCSAGWPSGSSGSPACSTPRDNKQLNSNGPKSFLPC